MEIQQGWTMFSRFFTPSEAADVLKAFRRQEKADLVTSLWTMPIHNTQPHSKNGDGGMSRGKGNCECCNHKRRQLIELALVHLVPMRTVAKRFELSLASVTWHKQHHMTPQLIAAIATAHKPSEIDLEQLQRSESEGLLASLVGQRARLQMLSEMAFEEKEIHAATGVERAITSSLELTSKLLGMIIHHHEVKSTSILISADYIRLRHSIITALKPFPDAARAVSAALHVLESEAAEDINIKKQPLLLEAS
jgi:hypothetical protein